MYFILKNGTQLFLAFSTQQECLSLKAYDDCLETDQPIQAQTCDVITHY